MTPERRRHLDAILAAPEEDLPRLAFADWLEENGESERAELIRLQIRHGKTTIYEIGRDAFVFVKASEDGPIKDVIIARGVEGLQYVTQRGFVAGLRGPLASLLEHGPAICTEHPVTAVEVTDAVTRTMNDGSVQIHISCAKDADWEWLADYASDSPLARRSEPAMKEMINTAVLAELRRRALTHGEG